MKILFLGPPCPRLQYALTQAGHTVYQTEEKLCFAWLLESQFDFCISYKYRHVIKKDVIEYFQGKCVNLHISFLPWCRGADPNLWSYLDNTPSGVTIHRIDEGIETGDILLQKKVVIDFERDTLQISYNKLTDAIENLFIENMGPLLHEHILSTSQISVGSFHLLKDKVPYLDLIEKLWWDTPVKCLIGMKDKRERETLLSLIPAAEIHCNFVFMVANDPITRSMSFQSCAILYDDHVAWFTKQMEQKIPFYIALYDGKPCGYVRLNSRNDEANISCALDVNYRGKNLGTEIVRKSTYKFLCEYGISKIIAHVKNVNEASKLMFKKACYIESESDSHESKLYYYPENLSW